MTSEILQDRSRTGKERPWRDHKVSNELLALAYDEVRPEKAKRLRTCASWLSFEQLPDGTKRLVNTFFCRVRLCPMCSWRRSLKVASQMHAIMDAIKADRPVAYILLTLTQRNCEPEDLDNEITLVLKAFNALTRLKAFKCAVLGCYRALEIDHNLIAGDRYYGTYHPHIHALLAVNPSYFTGRDYISQARWTDMWRQCLGLDYTPIVHVERVKGDTAAAVAEVAKYGVKSKDYVIPDDWEMTLDTVRLLDTVLNKRRFVAFGGIFRDYHRKLNLQDAEAGDLIHIDGETPPEKPVYKQIHFAWFSGYRQYRQDDAAPVGKQQTRRRALRRPDKEGV